MNKNWFRIRNSSFESLETNLKLEENEKIELNCNFNE